MSIPLRPEIDFGIRGHDGASAPVRPVIYEVQLALALRGEFPEGEFTRRLMRPVGPDGKVDVSLSASPLKMPGLSLIHI